MTKRINTTTLLIAIVLVTTPVWANDVDDVKAAVMSLYDSINSGDGARLITHYGPGYSGFDRGGGLLDIPESMEARRIQRQAIFDNVKLNLQVRNLEVQVYGNTAIVTCYLIGRASPPNAEPTQWTDRRTGVWVKQGGQWKEVHMHQSRLDVP